MGKIIDLTGQRFGKLTVLEMANKTNRHTYWVCLCDCGNRTIKRSDWLRSGNVVSCGCYGKQRRIEGIAEHQKSHDRIYHILAGMKDRCYNANNPRYKNYGGKGITVFPEWLDKENGFINFYIWSINNGYAENLTIDRIDVNGNYEPSNCRWVTLKEQNNNTTRTVKILYDNVLYTLTEFCKEFNLEYNKTYSRLQRQHWSVEKILNTP